MTLDIIVTHYKEPFSTGIPLLNSIAMQEMVDFDDIGVILVNDGEDNELCATDLTGFPYWIEQMSIPKGGVSKPRNAGLDASTADWVMFCDFDDCFSSIFALHMIFCAMNEDKYDTLWSAFTEETKDNNGKMVLVAHEHDYVFIHGKAHRRQYLLENNLRFHPKLTIHEDVFFTMMTQKICKPERIAGIKTPIYCWRWNGKSVVRKDNAEDYVLDTYDHLIRQRIALTDEFLKRGMMEDALTAVVKTICDAYYDCQQYTWQQPENLQKVRKAENWFAAYLKRYANYYVKVNPKITAEVASASRANALKKGAFFMERETLKEWLQHIMDTAKPIPEYEQNV